MKHESGIDQLFREGIGQPDFSGKDAAWAKMEQVLDADKRRRRPVAWLLIPALLLVTAGWWFLTPAGTEQHAFTPNSISDVSEPLSDKPSVTQVPTITAQVPPARVSPAKHTASITDENHQPAIFAAVKQKAHAIYQPGSVRMKTTVAGEEVMEFPATATEAQQLLSDNYQSPLNRLEWNPQPVHQLAVQASRIARPVFTGARKPDKVVKQQNKWSVELVAGSDIFRLNKQLGYYGGIRINHHLDAGTLISAGLNYSGNTLNEQYRLSNKPAQQTETDARLNHITMIRVPLYFQRQLPRSKWALMAGLVPSYIIDASVYNVPNSFTGDPTQYRRFTINDINRFNILFGAGVKYSPFKRVSFELSGSYGFTGLVKDSYINQSRVNDNFRNIQAGLVYRLR